MYTDTSATYPDIGELLRFRWGGRLHCGFFPLVPVREDLSLSLSFLVSPLPRVSCGGWVTPPSSSSLQPLATPGPLFFSLSLSALWLPRCSTKAARSHPSGFIGLGRLTGRM